MALFLPFHFGLRLNHGVHKPNCCCCCCCLVAKLCLTLWLHRLQHARLSCPSLSPGICWNSCPLNQWCYLMISCSASPFSSCPQSFPASGSFLMSGLFSSDGQIIGAPTLASVLPINIQGWFPLGLTSLIVLLSKAFSSVFSSNTVWKHQFFGAQSSLWSGSHIHIWLLERP